ISAKKPDADQCRIACEENSCVAVNIFQLGETDFMCEILQTFEGTRYATGAACYSLY
ncbi:unnamed protein product, partial [Enterobius vermicularis]|uniref:Apple domain-containing protein n=1 Tax=Enterobius vermicularis TaxID=51028 RepID=A0A0N4VQC9_ENTVE